MRDERHAEAGLSQTCSPASRASARMSSFVSPASTSGARTAWSRAADLAGAKIPAIVEVHPVGEMTKAQPRARFLHLREQLVLAVKAALQVVLHVVRILHLGGRNDLQRKTVALGEGYGVRKMRTRKRGRIGQHRDHLQPRNLPCRPRQKSGVHPARIGDEDAPQFGQPLVKPGLFSANDVMVN